MGNTRDTGYLRNLVAYDASGNIVLPANLTVNGNLLVATQSYVTTQINNLINGAPALLDTLDELAAALGDDANFASTITTSIAGKLSLTGGTLTGALNGTSATFSSFITAQSTGGSGLRVYGGSGTNQWDMYLNGTNLRFSDNTGTGSFVVDRPATFSSRVGVAGAAATYPITVYNASNGTTAAFGGTARGIRIDNDGTFSSGRSTIFGVDSSFYGSYQPLSIESSSLTLQAVTGGNVGIGTSDPQSQLHLSSTTPIMSFTDSNSFTDPLDRFIIRASENQGNVQWYDDSAATTLNIMTFRESGNVGIGTTSPIYALSVVKNTNEWIGQYKNYGSNAYGLQIDLSGSTGPTGGFVFGAYSQIGTGLFLKNNGNVLIGTTTDAGYKLDVAGDTRSNRLYLETNANSIFTKSNNASYNRFLYAGSNLHVVFTGGTTANGGGIGVNNFVDTIRIFNLQNNGDTFVLGNLGIGISPTAKLHIVTPAGADFQTAINLEKAGGYGNVFLQSYYIDVPNYGLAVKVGNVTGMVVNGAGNIGMGTTSPIVKLDVTGTTRVRSASSSIFTTSKYYSVSPNSTSDIFFDVNSEFGVGTGGYILVEITLSAYGNAGSGGGVYKYIAGGYSGHTIANAGYHKYEVIANTVGGNVSSITVYNPTWNVYGTTIVNSAGYVIVGVMEIRVTTTY